MLYIQNATVFTPERRIEDGAVLIDGRQIIDVGPTRQITHPPEAKIIDASGLMLAPGFIDLQINGAFGHDFTADPQSVWAVAARLPEYGVTTFLPTIVTAPLRIITTAQQVVTDRSATIAARAIPLGLHVEGPFLNPGKKGAHDPTLLRSPDLSAIRDWAVDHGVYLVTLAPELPGALDLVARLRARGVVVSAGHSAATYDQAVAGFDAGIRCGTHLFNAMPPLHHREPGLAGALLTDSRVVTTMIVDGIHNHPSVVTLAWRAKGSTRLCLVTDAMAGLGMPPGKQLLSDSNVVVDATSARLSNGTLAGSILSIDAALRNFISTTRCSLSQALPTVTTTPASLMGLGASRGRIAPGHLADLVLLTPRLEVHTTIVEGSIAYQHQIRTHDQGVGAELAVGAH
jgi:N-acetylglucosamine-6-phosphate deacetylase